ncbi:hypothetical protein AB1Y20_020567 [Prymnesium parvum]|uniref:Protein RFT1 homolog n=1 Tax=Prymnesium parvum TaxID=97485 RepID=A0AB34JTU2_PRYPA
MSSALTVLAVCVLNELSYGASNYHFLVGLAGRSPEAFGKGLAFRLGSWACTKWQSKLTIAPEIEQWTTLLAILLRVAAVAVIVAIVKGFI